MVDASIISVRVESGVAVGEIKCPNVGEREAGVIREEIESEAKAVGSRVVLDFANVQMMGSLTLGMLVTLTKQCKAAKGVLVLCGLNDHLNGLLKMSRLDKLLTIAPDLASAVRRAKK